VSDFSLIGGSAYALEAGYDYSATAPTDIASSATIHTLGSYVELLSAANNTYPITEIEILFSKYGSSSGNQGNMLFNLAIGGAGSEQIIIPNILIEASTSVTNTSVYRYCVPISIPSGVRISMNAQSQLTGATTIGASLILTAGALGSDGGLSTVDDIGATTATTRGTVVATSGTIDTFGSWVEMSASLAKSYKGFVISAFKASGSWSGLEVTYEVGVGSAGNEEVIFSGQHIITGTQEFGSGMVSGFKPVGVASGERIAIRAQSDSTNADKNLDYVFYGVR